MDHARALIEQDRLLGELVGDADPETAVPACPGWSLRNLLTHVGRGHRWAAAIVAQRADARVDMRSVPDGKPPADVEAAVVWLIDSSRLLLDAVAATGADTEVWTFTGPRPAAWWVRRRLHESVVHRADAAFALGVPYAVDADLAADGVSEWLSLLAARRADADRPLLAGDATLHLHATDDGLGADGEWMVRGGASGISWEHGHGKGSAAVRGAAVDLLLAAMRRIPADDTRLQVLGDAAVWTTLAGAHRSECP
ncbi:maleylpyruvate isomerase family mycothiol-dependent enzyme [Pseudonocardia nigra]|uniref:maleylpyruvate isomerase family mycothiol-dependent enzyme n=1 Tax=Pseudonocardia nigra TaxID=1921578 RepID=UPI001C5EB35F|nr:maleylpyruvate isomerase family mycothiol-dependent enzyme [Pseudonocardia nigra]